MAVLIAPLILAGCGAEDRPARPAADERTSARFVETIRYVNEGEETTERTRGVFDWTATRGWAHTDSGAFVRQVGTDCFEQTDDGRWRQWQLREQGDLCPLVPPSPALPLDERLPGVDLERLGTEELGGVTTTHFRAFPDVEAPIVATDFDDGPIEVWVDEEAGLLHQWFQASLPSEALDKVALRYAHFGLDVDVERPPPRLVDRTPKPRTTLTPEEAREAACAGSYDKGKPADCYKGDK